MTSDTQDEAFTVGRTLGQFRALVRANNATITENSKINLVSEYCKISECKSYTPPDIAILFNKILWVNWAISALVTFVGIIVMYRKWIKRKRTVEDWPYCVTVYGCISMSKFAWVPERIISLFLFLKIVPSLVIDVVDILFDNIYFSQLVTSYDKVLNENIHMALYVFIILFTFQITGTIKNIILVWLANKKVDDVGHSMTEEKESALRDTNAYMAITYYQAILAFCLQDGPEALTQYLYVDKYLEDFNWVAAVASILRVLMSCRTMFIFSRFIYGFVDQAFHSLRVRCFLWGLIGVKFVIFSAHTLRSIAVIFTTESSQTNIDCIRLTPNHEMVQTPMSCLDSMDLVLLTLSGLSVLGVGFGLFVAYKYGNKVFNQSHSSGRDATIWMVREMRKTIFNPKKWRIGSVSAELSGTKIGTGPSTENHGRDRKSRVNPRVWMNRLRPSVLQRAKGTRSSSVKPEQAENRAQPTSILTTIENMSRKTKESLTNESVK